VEIATVPPCCPLSESASDFSGANELIERAAHSTRRWLDGGGLAQHHIPAAQRAHVDWRMRRNSRCGTAMRAYRQLKHGLCLKESLADNRQGKLRT
jgi:hypothetical protein